VARDQAWLRYLVPGLLALALLTALYVPPYYHLPLFGLAVVFGARKAYQEAVLRAELRQAHQRLQAIHKIALSLSTTLDPNRLLEVILEQLGQLWGYDYGAVLLLDESGELVLTAGKGYLQEPGYRIPASHGICGAVLQSGEPICVSNVAREPRYIAGIRGAKSELAVPLIWEGKIVGVLNVESRTPNAYSAADVDLLRTVAEQAAAAIDNARLHEATRHMALTDYHTGLFNYRHFQEQVTATVRNAQLTGTPCSLIMMDLDHFKRCNDTYGHPTGDAILQQVARVLRDSIRQGDLLFRYGGEEFAVILPDTLQDDALRVADRIRERVAEHPFTTRSGRPLDFALSVSLGVATSPADGLTPVDVVLAADHALYAAKAAGRNRVAGAELGAQAEPA
jgi:diguanylate cyclase (GGDEF)-like protein